MCFFLLKRLKILKNTAVKNLKTQIKFGIKGKFDLASTAFMIDQIC